MNPSVRKVCIARGRCGAKAQQQPNTRLIEGRRKLSPSKEASAALDHKLSNSDPPKAAPGTRRNRPQHPRPPPTPTKQVTAAPSSDGSKEKQQQQQQQKQQQQGEAVTAMEDDGGAHSKQQKQGRGVTVQRQRQ
ncbi:uncharacterized protein MONBRDRAFT_25826 [Monosiga brevicollis MX1]|uniref:Uncharacterized protein n=1 Tax=Monosiga brevicollis TaxID=81824 RepID=A9V0J6_MONBE|nr:uncharacterized protein MONBRDRAFT_25826 [Monosiga brevicollis MX1]EDQ89163.1 predicted protein [Monosiga brevicollis MX1]|eukprot:XP_001746268.1 hypothetical protein [Monosiga brevicollis MX1]